MSDKAPKTYDCKACSGTGWKTVIKDGLLKSVKCFTCKGTGRVTKRK